MSLINRIALSNYSNAQGEDSDIWNPRFLNEILDFRGQSAVVNLANGGGKTTAANAVIGLLSRHHTLLKRAKEHAALRKIGYWSHVQVELIEPLHDGMNSDMFTQAGGQVSGETWVFGMTMSRDADSNDYYYYPGRLEDLAPCLRQQGKLIFIRNEEFREASKKIKGIEWGVTRDNWRSKIGQHIPIEALLGLAEFQIKGGSDKDAPIFKLAQLKKDVRLDEVFFYEILAPELLHDVLDDTEGDESSSIDQKLFHIIRNVVNTRHRLSAHKVKVDEMAIAMKQLREAAELGETALQASNAYETNRREHALDLAVLTDLVSKHPVPGVPRLPLPNDACRDVAAHLVVIPGESAPRISNQGLAILLNEEVKLVKRKADRMGILGHKSSQVIDIPCHLKMDEAPKHGGARYQSVCYTIKQATNLLKKHAKEDALVLFEDAVAWFDNKSDTNPFRQALMEIEAEHSEAVKETNEQGERIEKLQEASIDLANSREQVLADQAAYEDIKSSGLFTEEEWRNPGNTAKQTNKQLEDATQALNEFGQLRARLQDYIPDWQSYIDNFGDENPDAIHRRLSESEETAKSAVVENQEATQNVESSVYDHQDKVNTLNAEASRSESLLATLKGLKKQAQPILDTLQDGENPVGLEARRRKAREEAKSNLDKCRQELKDIETGIQSIANFHEIIPDIEPASWISDANKKRDTLTIHQSNLTKKRNDLARQKEALEVDPVAANAVAQEALDALAESNVTYDTLHGFLLKQNFPEDRLKDLLGMFSALLFAPVIKTEDNPLSAVEILAKADLPVPVFLADSLNDFCLGSSVSRLRDLGRVGIIAGHVTRQVECILDPTLVEREKESLALQIETVDKQLLSIEEELEVIDPEGDLVQKARVAAASVAAGHPLKIEAARKQHVELENAFEQCEQLLTDEMVSALRAAEAYVKEGGDEQAALLAGKLQKITKEKEDAQEKLQELTLQLKSLRSQVYELNNAVAQAYPAETKNIVSRAGRFIELDGPNFLQNQETTSSSLEEAKQNASARAEYKHYFPRAERWLNYQKKLEKGEDIDDQIHRNKTEIAAAKKSREKAEKTIEVLEAQLPSLRERVEAIDLAAIALLKKYKHASLAGNEMSNIDIQETDIDNHIIGDAAWKLRNALEVNDSNIVEKADSLTKIVDEYDIDTELETIKRLYRKKEDAIGAFVSRAKDAARTEKGLAQVERERLLGVSGVDAASWVNQFAENYWKLYSKEEDELKQLSTDEKAVNSKFTERLALLMEAASDNLAALRSVASKDPKGMISHFEVTAKVTKQEEMTAIIDRIVDLVDVYETRRREDEEHNRPVERSDKGLATLQADIRETLYRSVFSDVSVKYANEQIRPDGKAHRFSASLSTGQKNALLMMWVLRLAQYRVEREARKRVTSLSKRRSRNQAQSIMIIDGLFSNLSDPKLIQSVMSSLTVTRGHFQLIGLVHDPKYQHDFELFPVFIMGKSQNDQSWVSFENVDASGALAFAKLVKNPAHVTG